MEFSSEYIYVETNAETEDIYQGIVTDRIV